MIKGSNRIPRITSDALDDIRHRPMAQSVPSTVAISGRVSHGDKKGRTIGFPTINVCISRRLSPVLGVFNVLVEINKEAYHGVCNVGKRPTVGGEKTLLEVFIFDFNREIYGERVTIVFKQKSREEMKFDSFEELKQQIAKDVEIGKQYFKSSAVLG